MPFYTGYSVALKNGKIQNTRTTYKYGLRVFLYRNITYQNYMYMGNSRLILFECGKDLGFTLHNGRVVLHIGNNDAENMRNDVRKVGNDLRAVMERQPL